MEQVDPQRFEQRKEAARDAILEAAHRVLVQVGYEQITTRRIAKEAGVNIATLHYYFGSKEQLLSEAVRYALSHNQARVRAITEESTDVATALKQAFQLAWQIVREHNEIVRYDLVIRGLRDDEARNEAQKVYTAYRQMLEQIVERHIAAGGTLNEELSPAQFAHCIVSAVDGVILQHAVMQDDDAAQKSLAMILHYALTLLGLR